MLIIVYATIVASAVMSAWAVYALVAGELGGRGGEQEEGAE